MMIVIVSVTTLVMMVISLFATCIIAAGITANQMGLSISAIDAFKICMDYPDFATAFYRDLALIILFTLLGIGCQIFYLSKRIKRKQNIK